jgi:uncharacterized protein (DUF736 family)
MAEYDNTNRFALFPVKDKKNPKGPDLDGKGDCNGREIRVAAWKKVSQNGNAFLSCKIEFTDERPKREDTGGSTSPKPDNDIGF